MFKKYKYVIVGNKPHVSISKKIFVGMDEFNCCLRNIDTNNIDLYSRYLCFDTFEEACVKSLEMIQKEK